ncbi:MAG TPA: TM0106 family RecB-like putative nuclease, partial [Chroococcidiopsis sp.]
MQRDRQEPEVFIAHNRCDLCHWYSHCYSIAQAEQHLSLLPGVTPSRYIHLKASQLLTVESLAAIAPERLAPMPGFGVPVAQKLVAQAQATLHNRAIARPASPVTDPDEPLLFPHELPTSPIELYFDIEAAPEQNLVYLHGVLVVDRPQCSETFYPLLADDPEHEGRIWTQFLELVSQYPDAPIYHFCPYEVQTVRRLAEYYGTPFAAVEPILERFVDLHERVTRVAILPVESYALKAIARWIGFDWRNPEANGAQSIYWYAQWLSTGDRTYLDAIVQYNEDDCRATYHVKNWLVEFASQPIRHGGHGGHG